VRSPGFEPGIISLEGFHTANGYRQFNVLNQTRRRPLNVDAVNGSSDISSFLVKFGGFFECVRARRGDQRAVVAVA
jgi:hypothetical protein